MGSLAQAKTLGGAGSVLVILSIVPYAGLQFVLGITGFALVLIAIKYISDAVGNKSIFKNMIIAVALAIVGVTVGAVGLFTGLSLFTISGFLHGRLDPSALVGSTIPLTIQVALALIWAFSVVSALFLRKSFNAIASSLNIGTFHTAALIHIIGAALVIVLIGFVIIIVAEIIQAIAFFSIPDPTPQSG